MIETLSPPRIKESTRIPLKNIVEAVDRREHIDLGMLNRLRHRSKEMV